VHGFGVSPNGKREGKERKKDLKEETSKNAYGAAVQSPNPTMWFRAENHEKKKKVPRSEGEGDEANTREFPLVPSRSFPTKGPEISREEGKEKKKEELTATVAGTEFNAAPSVDSTDFNGVTSAASPKGEKRGKAPWPETGEWVASHGPNAAPTPAALHAAPRPPNEGKKKKKKDSAEPSCAQVGLPDLRGRSFVVIPQLGQGGRRKGEKKKGIPW